MYLTYDEYVNMEGNLSRIEFEKAEFRAEKKVDELTSSRFRTLKDYPKELKMCIFDLLELSRDESNIISESLGNYSKTTMTKEQANNQKTSIIKQYLSDVKVNGIYCMYCGADIRE